MRLMSWVCKWSAFPTEVANLEGHHVGSENGTIAVVASKMKMHHVPPPFPKLSYCLLRLFENGKENARLAFEELRPLLKPNGTENANLRTQLKRYTLRAGLVPGRSRSKTCACRQCAI
jgi:hypothetical protein